MATDLMSLKRYREGQSNPAKVAPVVEPAFEASTTFPHFPINMDRSAPIDMRAGGGFKNTTEGLVGFLENYYGSGNVATDADGQAFILDREAGEWFPYNSEGLTGGDLFSLGGEALRVGPTMGTNSPLGVGWRAGGGSVLAQAASEIFPGDDQMSASDRALDVGGSALLGGVTQKGANAALSVFDTVGRPHNYVSRYLNKRLSTDEATQGRALEGEFGTVFSPAQLALSTGLGTVESVARRHPLTADKILAQLDSQRQAIVGRLNNLLEGWNPGEVGGFATGTEVSNAFNQALGKVLQIRRTQAASDFRFLDEAVSGQGIFNLTETTTVIDDLIRRFDTPGSGQPAKKLVSELQSIRSEITDEMGLINPISATNMQNLLQNWGSYAAGTGKPFVDIETSQGRMLAGEIFGALKKDLDSAADRPLTSIGQNEAILLQRARDNYRINSEPIAELEQSVLGSIFKGGDVTPERVAERFRNMRPSEIENVFSTLEAASPTTANQVKRYLIEDALMASRQPRVSRIGEDQFGDLVPTTPTAENLSSAKLLEKLQASPVWPVLTSSEKFEMALVVDALERNAFMVGEGSPTAPLQWAMELVRGVGGAVSGLDPMIAARVAAGVWAPQKLAAAMTTHEGRQAVMTLTRTNARTQDIAGAISYLSTIPVFMDVSGFQGVDVAPNPGLDASLATTPSVSGNQGVRNLLQTP